MFDTVPQALALSVYLLIFACLVRFITLLSKRPFPVNAPKFAPGYPVVGALRFFFNRERFCYDSKTASPTGNYSYYLGRHRVVGLSGPQGRKTFFESRDLDLDQGVNLFVAFGSVVERASDRTTETHDSYLRTSLRTAFLRTESLEFMPAAIHACTTSTWNRIAAQSLIMKCTWTRISTPIRNAGIRDASCLIVRSIGKSPWDMLALEWDVGHAPDKGWQESRMPWSWQDSSQCLILLCVISRAIQSISSLLPAINPGTLLQGRNRLYVFDVALDHR